MFDFKDISSMMKLAGAAKEVYEKQERLQQENLQMLKKISEQLNEILQEIKSGKKQ